MISKLRISLAAVALSAVAMAATPGQASAITPITPACTGSVTLGFGGYFSGCYTSFTVARFFENAGDVSTMNWFTGVPARNSTTNAPTPGGTYLFNNNCGSSGANATTGVFCNPSNQTTFGWGVDMELVFGLNNTSNSTWLYSGTDPDRNDPPAPAGVQNWLWSVQGGAWDGWYLFGWEDKNSGCFSASTAGGNTIDGTLLDATHLGANVVHCNARNSGNLADNDYNDFYVLIQPYQDPGNPGDVVPEPMTMTLLATGLLGMGGASVVRRRRRR